MGVFPSEGDALTAFKAAADALRSEASFVYVTDAKLVKDADGKEAVVLYRDFDEETVKFDGKIEKVRFCEAIIIGSIVDHDCLTVASCESAFLCTAMVTLACSQHRHALHNVGRPHSPLRCDMQCQARSRKRNSALQAELIKWVEALSVPKLPSLDRSPKNKKALQAAFADQKPKVLGVMEADAKDIKGFKDALIAAKDAVDDVHVRFIVYTCAHGLLVACTALQS